MAKAKSRRADGATDAAPLSKRARKSNGAENLQEGGAEAAPVNLYSGFQVPHDGYKIERIDVNDVTPEEFFTRYVATRKPVVLKGFITDEEFTAPTRWSNAHLREVAGDVMLKVEERGNATEKFGRGVEVDMTMNKLIDLIESGDDLHYLTTQDVEADDEGRPEIMAPFVACLQDDFPLRPAILGNLVPQNINIWMGNNKHGSSSGLHHDYHDNLYILLRGKKRFRLYSPAETEIMYTRGNLVKVHTNGRINYEGEETTAYGADPFSEAAALAAIEKEEAERELFLAERAVDNGEDGAEQRLEQAEARLDKAMVKLLRADGDDDGADDDDDDGENGAFHFDDDEDDDEDEDEQPVDVHEEEDEGAKKKVDKTVKDPDNFSRVDTSLLKSEEGKRQLAEQFPMFASAKAAFCEIEVGEMLFLPASWFHEVESFGSADGHLALNYWYHPPDQPTSFDEPYSSPFWPRDWELRMRGQREEQDDYEDEDEDEEEEVDGQGEDDADSDEDDE